MYTTHIYALIDPETNEVRYVGKSNMPELRYQQHQMGHNMDTNKTARKLKEWFDELESYGLKPIMNIIENVEMNNKNDDDWKESEKKWVAHFKDAGHDLFNYSFGGDDTSFKGNGWKPNCFTGNANVPIDLDTNKYNKLKSLFSKPTQSKPKRTK